MRAAQRVLLATLGVVALFLGALLLGSCGDSTGKGRSEGASAPIDVARSFLRAVREGRSADALALAAAGDASQRRAIEAFSELAGTVSELTTVAELRFPEFARRLRGEAGGVLPMAGIEARLSGMPVVIEGDTATVGGPSGIELKRLGSEWKVDISGGGAVNGAAISEAGRATHEFRALAESIRAGRYSSDDALQRAFDGVALLLGLPDADLSDRPERAMSARQERCAAWVKELLASSESVWTRLLRGKTKTAYAAPMLVLFARTFLPADASGTTASGHHYNSRTESVNVDLSFSEDIRRRVGAEGDLLEAYVIAHLVGHHVQSQLGLLDMVRGASRQSDAAGFRRLMDRVELHADYLAGVWAHHAEMSGLFRRGDLETVMRAVSELGDERLRSVVKGRIVPDSFTHGSLAQRVAWFRHGLETGDMGRLDVFGAGEPPATGSLDSPARDAGRPEEPQRKDDAPGMQRAAEAAPSALGALRPPTTDERVLALASELASWRPKIFAAFRPLGPEERKARRPGPRPQGVVVYEPVGTVLELRPRFRWLQPDGDGRERVVRLMDERGVLLFQGSSSGSSLDYPASAPDLSPGSRYVWSLDRGVGAQGKRLTHRAFAVAAMPESAAFEEARTALELGAGELAPLLLASWALRRGLLVESARAARAYVASHPGDVAAEETLEFVLDQIAR